LVHNEGLQGVDCEYIGVYEGGQLGVQLGFGKGLVEINGNP